MDKLKMSTPDLTDKNIEQIGMLFPNVITEVEDGTTKDTKGHEIKKYKKVVDFDLLRQMLSKDLVEDDNERYRLDWPGKKASLLKANTPITKTLRPCLEESSGKDGNPGKFDSENLYIEGDNFEVLKILQESYLGKIKMIYIDPPYNTGNDFIYKDNFAMNNDEWRMVSGELDEEGGKLFRNTDSNGRYHSDWLSMMYERLVVARDLLKDDGVIFISIDDNEVHNLRKICDEVFGEENIVAQVIVQTNPRGRTFDKFIAKTHEYILTYVKNIDVEGLNEIPKDEKAIAGYSKEDDGGQYRLLELRNRNPVFNRINRPLMFYPIYADPDKLDVSLTKTERHTIEIYPRNSQGDDGCWTWGLQKATNETSLLVANLANTGKWSVFRKDYLEGSSLFTKSKAIWLDKEMNHENGKEIMGKMFGKTPFDFPKSIEYIKKCLQIGSSKDSPDIILDFFSGSATTAHAVIQLNAEELAEEFTTKDTKSTKNEDESFSDVSSVSWLKKGKRKFIMVQLPEPCDENSEAFKAGYKTIAEIGKERIRRAGKKILEEATTKNTKGTKKEEENNLFDNESLSNVSSVSWLKNLDIGFRVYKTDSTNMKDVFYHPSDLKQDLLSGLESNIKEDRTPEDLLTQVILDLGLELTLPIETKKILGNTVFIVQTNALVACFDKDIDFNIVDTISDLKPLKVVFKDASFKDDKDRINVEERFKRLSPETKVTVI